MQTKDILQIMAGMAQYKIGLVEAEGLKLMLQPERIQSPVAASGLMPSNVDRPVTSEDAFKATAEARVEAKKQADLRLALQQQRTAAARQKAAGGIGRPSTGKLVDDVFKASKRAPKNTA